MDNNELSRKNVGVKIGVASDHRGYDLKQKVTKYLREKGYDVIDFGCSNVKKADYPIYGFKLGEGIRDGIVRYGIAICGSGIGISIACNKVRGVRCSMVNNIKDVKWGRNDNDLNCIAFSGKTPYFIALDLIDAFLNTPFSGEERHIKRIKMLDSYGENDD